ncbi:MAG: D-alanyl-D-alanine carboxypeptidase/D-alanyl-D-alanine-endopeptidase [Microscillaceae bacterium]|jgi:D-alanyl-D-alanine carboxypeptidase/D-alanyl-D-alanine-endopeptidase (penicillin-binding protein 4)|nr:D-alanyl-D-alanine carboxypeptidase/D-alanyl-D-alanine-endopeptidase [Microscillaceae bacterium]
MKIIPYCLLASIALLITCSQSSKNQAITQNNQPVKSINTEKLQKAIAQLANDSAMVAGTLAFSLQSAQSGKKILNFNSQKTVNVASCFKALTTAVALAKLGNRYTFKTTLEHSGRIENGNLKGDLYIRGGGDPTLGSMLMPGLDLGKTLDIWVQKIKNAGIRQIEGGVIADEELFNPNLIPYEWTWGDIGNYYGAPAGAINVLDNTYKLYFRPGKLGAGAVILKTEPNLPDLKFVNEVKTAEAGSGDQAVIVGTPYDPVRIVSGKIPMGGVFAIRGSLPDPAGFLAQQLTQRLKFAGIAIVKAPTTSRQLKLNQTWQTETRQLIYQHLSPSLKEIVDFTNFYSVNLYAEAILKILGWHENQRASTLSGTQAVQKYWANKGIDNQGFYMQDGSGMALANGITTQQLTEIFYSLSREPYFQSFYTSLPVAGLHGTMKSVGAGTKLQNNLRAKSGGMTRVLAYVGYFRTQSGELMCFAIAANQYLGKYAALKKKIDEILLTMVMI